MQVIRPRRQERHHREREHQRPADRLPRSEFARHPPALRVPDGAERDGPDEQDVGDAATGDRPVCGDAEQHRRDHAEAHAAPEAGRRAFVGQQHRDHRGRRREQSDDDRGVTGRRVPHGQRRQDREPGHHPGRHRDQVRPLSRLGQRYPECEQDHRGQDAGDDGSSGTHEQRIESGVRADRDAGERQRERERENAEQAPAEAGSRHWRY